jgi:ABC-2 type transport system permease protein
MSGFAGMLRLAWRRNRVFYTCWVLGLAVLMPATVTKYHDLVPDGTDGQLMLAQLASNPTMRAILGPPFDLGTAGGFTFWRVGTFVAAAAAMMAALGVIRATRAEEEEGRVELVRSGAVSRAVPLAAGIVLSLAACFATGVLIALFMLAAKTPAAGAWASGLGIALTGTMFTGVAAVLAQVFPSARTARVWSLGIVLGGLYLLRAMVDGSGSSATLDAIRWAMPLDWASQVRPYASERWWVLLLPLALTVVLVGLAFRLEALRDHGAGLKAASEGAAEAAPYLSGAVGLSWRLQRVGVIGWTFGILVSAIGIGSLSTSLGQMFEGQDQLMEMLRKMGGGAEAIRDAFFIAMLGIMATIVTLAGVMVLSRLRAEESGGRSEVMLATATSRWRYGLSTLLPAVLLPVILLVATGSVMPVAQAATDGSASLVGTITVASLVMLPGIVLVMGLAMLLVGLLPRWYGIVWAVLGWSILVSWIMPLFDPPDWLLRLHPWGFLPHLPTDPMRWGAFSIELALGLGMMALGLVAYRRRDIAGR